MNDDNRENDEYSKDGLPRNLDPLSSSQAQEPQIL